MPDIDRQYLSLGFGLGVFYNAEKFNIKKIPLARKRLGEDETKTKLIKFSAVEIEQINDNKIIETYGALDYHGASGDEPKDHDQRKAELGFLSEKAEQLRAERGLKRVVILGDFNQPVYQEKTGIPKGQGTSHEHFEIHKEKLFHITQTLMGKNLVLQAITTPQYIVSKQRVGANIVLSQQAAKGGVPGNPKETDYDSKTILFELVERPAGMTQAQAEERAQKIIGELTVPNTPNFVREFGPNAFTDGSDHAPLVPTIINDETIGAHALIGSAGMTGFMSTTDLFIRDLTEADLFDQHIAALKLQEILTRKFFNSPHPEIEVIQKQLDALEAELEAEAKAGHENSASLTPDLESFIEKRMQKEALTEELASLKKSDAELVQLEITYKASLTPEKVAAFDLAKAELAKLDADNALHPVTEYIKFIKEHAHGGPLGDYLLKAEPNRILLKQLIEEWIITPEYKKMASLFKGKKGWEVCLEDEEALNIFLKGIKKEPITDIAQKIDRQPSAGYKPAKGSPREDQFRSLYKDKSSLCFVTEAGDLTPEMIALRNPKLRGHLNAHADMRDVAELFNLINYLNGFETTVQQELGYVEANVGAQGTLSETLIDLRRMVLKKTLLDLLPLSSALLAFTPRTTFFNPQFSMNKLLGVDGVREALFTLALDQKNAIISRALLLHPNLNIQTQIMQLINGKSIGQFNHADIAVITGYISANVLGDKPEILRLLFKKIILERSSSHTVKTLTKSHAKLFDALPELAAQACEAILCSTFEGVNAFLQDYPAVLMNTMEQLTKLIASKNTIVLDNLKRIIAESPILQEELKINLLDFDPETTNWVKPLLDLVEAKRPEPESKKAPDAEIKNDPIGVAKKPSSQEPVVKMHITQKIEELNLCGKKDASINLPPPQKTYLPSERRSVKDLASQFDTKPAAKRTRSKSTI